MNNNNNNNNLVGVTFKNNYTKPQCLLREINLYFAENNLPLFISTIVKNEDDYSLVSEATLPEEVGINDIPMILKFNRFLSNCGDFILPINIENETND